MLRNVLIIIGSVFSCVLLILTAFPSVVAFQQVTNQQHKQKLSLKSLVKTPPQTQGIALGLIYLVIAVIVFLTFFINHYQQYSHNISEILYNFISSIFAGLFWPFLLGFIIELLLFGLAILIAWALHNPWNFRKLLNTLKSNIAIS